tara:strand:+ start:205 stop:963 length:759 start_codon:yes stop_codon:yes gene_type:complete
MKKLIYLFLIIILLVPKQSKAQDSSAAKQFKTSGIPGSYNATAERMKEKAELKATEWILANQPGLNSFYVSTLDFNSKKTEDLSSVSVITFRVREFNIPKKNKVSKWAKSNGFNVYDYGDKFVLYAFKSKGWTNEYDVDFSKLRWYFYKPSDWLDMITEYVSVASGIKDKSFISTSLLNGKLTNRGVRVKSKLVIPFNPLKGDMYVVSDYSDDMKLIYNEKTLGVFLKETKDLVQIKRSALVNTFDFLFKEK